MADLVARGPNSQVWWRRTLPAQPVTLGRVPAASEWAVPGDRQISKVHATLTWCEGTLAVCKCPTAKNSIFFKGHPLEEFTAAVGEQFVIGQTTFLLEEEAARARDLPTPQAELTCGRQELERVKYPDADERIEALAALPAVIRHSPSDEELERRVVEVLLRGIARADEAAVVWLDPVESAGVPQIHVRTAARRDGPAADFHPSRRLLLDAIRRRQSVLHIWDDRQQEDFTVGRGEWALCAPLPDEPSPGWALYVTGPHTSSALAREDLQKGDLKFAEMVADIFGALRHVRDLERRHTMLARFLSRPVLMAIAHQDIEEVLRPRQAEVTVLFCDLRGSCRIAEEGAAELAGMCDRVSEALTIMTGHIIDMEGVIGDFQGDAAMGFWGWPLESGDRIEQAARAALAIQRDFLRASKKTGNPLAGFACGIGIASGSAIAGRLGTFDQFKVSVFGPVVNLASRLESLTKRFRVSILVDECTAAALAGTRHLHGARCRRLAKIQPYGMSQTLVVSELLPPAVEHEAMAERDCRDYEAALDAFLASRWPDAAGLLSRLPGDGAAAVLKEFMSRHGQRPPEHWDGVMAMDAK